MTGIYEQTAIGLFFVLSLILVFAYIHRKRQKSSGIINLIAYQSLGQKTGVAALKIKGEILIIGVTQSDLKVLKRLDEKETVMDETNGIAENIRKLKKLKEEV